MLLVCREGRDTAAGNTEYLKAYLQGQQNQKSVWFFKLLCVYFIFLYPLLPFLFPLLHYFSFLSFSIHLPPPPPSTYSTLFIPWPSPPNKLYLTSSNSKGQFCVCFWIGRVFVHSLWQPHEIQNWRTFSQEVQRQDNC